MSVSQSRPTPPREDRLSAWMDRLILALARHWVAFFAIMLLLYAGLPFLAPVLMRVGLPGPARIIYTIYMPACHQLPDRSYFLFGEKTVYTLSELEQANVLPGVSVLQRRHYIGDETLGWKVALCERDVAIYAMMLVMGLIFAALKRRIAKIPVWVFVVFVIPIAVDGLSQLAGLRTSNWWLRSVTGALFGAGLVWLAYPHLDEAMHDIRLGLERKRGKS
ncbi:MAG: DUF2085 domain-containing protein [Caldilineales bacterium]